LYTDPFDIALVRIDNRLVHGQILEAWVPFIKAQCIIVVNDEVASDFYNETVIRMAVPSEIEVIINSVEEFSSHHITSQSGGKRTMVLFANLADAFKSYNLGFHFKKLNIGNIYNEKYDLSCASSVFLCDAEIKDMLCIMEKENIEIELKRVPREKDGNFKEILKEYCETHQ